MSHYSQKERKKEKDRLEHFLERRLEHHLAPRFKIAAVCHKGPLRSNNARDPRSHADLKRRISAKYCQLFLEFPLSDHRSEAKTSVSPPSNCESLRLPGTLPPS